MVGSGVSEGTGVLEAVLVGLGVGEGVSVRVGVTVGVKLGLGVRVTIVVTLASRCSPSWPSEQAASAQINARAEKTITRLFMIHLQQGQL
jgi:hypothetical protein